MRWTLDKIRESLLYLGAKDAFALGLLSLTDELLRQLADIVPLYPLRNLSQRFQRQPAFRGGALLRGLEAIAWTVEERGLGGGRELDGLSWCLSLSKLWEDYVESAVRRTVANHGGSLSVGRLGETTFPVYWSNPSHRSLGHLVPDMVVRKSDSVWIVDAKYKAHLAEIDEVGWQNFQVAMKEAHRADLHQVLAYAALYEAREVKCSLVYPLRRSTWENLKARGLDVSRADLTQGGKQVRLELIGLPFGGSPKEPSLPMRW